MLRILGIIVFVVALFAAIGGVLVMLDAAAMFATASIAGDFEGAMAALTTGGIGVVMLAIGAIVVAPSAALANWDS
jgi:hypothetical protein